MRTDRRTIAIAVVFFVLTANTFSGQEKLETKKYPIRVGVCATSSTKTAWQPPELKDAEQWATSAVEKMTRESNGDSATIAWLGCEGKNVADFMIEIHEHPTKGDLAHTSSKTVAGRYTDDRRVVLYDRVVKFANQKAHRFLGFAWGDRRFGWSVSEFMGAAMIQIIVHPLVGNRLEAAQWNREDHIFYISQGLLPRCGSDCGRALYRASREIAARQKNAIAAR